MADESDTNTEDLLRGTDSLDVSSCPSSASPDRPDSISDRALRISELQEANNSNTIYTTEVIMPLKPSNNVSTTITSTGEPSLDGSQQDMMSDGLTSSQVSAKRQATANLVHVSPAGKIDGVVSPRTITEVHITSSRYVIDSANKSYENLIHSADSYSVDPEVLKSAEPLHPAESEYGSPGSKVRKHLRFADEILASCQEDTPNQSASSLGAGPRSRSSSRSPARHRTRFESPSDRSRYTSLLDNSYTRKRSLSPLGKSVGSRSHESLISSPRRGKMGDSQDGSGADSGPASPKRNQSTSPFRRPVPTMSYSPPRTRSVSPGKGLLSAGGLPMSPGLIAAKAALHRATARSGEDYSHVVTDDINRIKELRAALRAKTGSVENVDDLLVQQKPEERAPFVYRSRYSAPTTSERSLTVENALLRDSLEQEIMADRSLAIENQVLRESLDKEREVDRSLSLENQVLRESLDKERRIDQGLIQENALLKDTVDDEKYLRKQSEGEILVLKNRLDDAEARVQMEQMVLSQKNAMVEELDDTLAKVVLGWQRKEGERLDAVEALEKERKDAILDVADYKRKVLVLEDELQKAHESIELEQRRYNRMDLEKNSQVSELEDRIELLEGERGRLTESLTGERTVLHRLEKEKSLAVSGRDHMVRELAEAQTALDNERQRHESKEQDLLEKIDEITSLQIRVLENEQKKMESQVGRQREVEAKLDTSRRELQQLQSDLENSHQTQERLRETMNLERVRHDNAVRQLKDDYSSEIDSKLSDMASKSLQNLADREVELSQAHRKQVAELNETHARQLADITERYGMDTAKMRDSYEEQLNHFEDQVKDLTHQVAELKESKLRVEIQRNQTNARLQHMMQTHANEALRVITNGTTYLSPVHVTPSVSPKKSEYEALTHESDEVGSDVIRTGSSKHYVNGDDGGTVATVNYVHYSSAAGDASAPPPQLFSDHSDLYMGEALSSMWSGSEKAASMAGSATWGEKTTGKTKESLFRATFQRKTSPDMYPHSHLLSQESSLLDASKGTDLSGFPRDLSSVKSGTGLTTDNEDSRLDQSNSVADMVQSQGLTREQELHLYIKKLLNHSTTLPAKTESTDGAFVRAPGPKPGNKSPVHSGRASPTKRGRRGSPNTNRPRFSPRRKVAPHVKHPKSPQTTQNGKKQARSSKYQVMTPEKVNEIAELISKYGKEDTSIDVEDFLSSLKDIKNTKPVAKPAAKEVKVTVVKRELSSSRGARRDLTPAFGDRQKEKHYANEKSPPTKMKSPKAARKTRKLNQPAKEKKRSGTAAWK